MPRDRRWNRPGAALILTLAALGAGCDDTVDSACVGNACAAVDAAEDTGVRSLRDASRADATKGTCSDAGSCADDAPSDSAQSADAEDSTVALERSNAVDADSDVDARADGTADGASPLDAAPDVFVCDPTRGPKDEAWCARQGWLERRWSNRKLRRATRG